MIKILFIITAFLLILSLVACKPNANDASELNSDTMTTIEEVDTNPSTEENENTIQSQENGKQTQVIELPKIPF